MYDAKLAWGLVCVVAFERSRGISVRYPFLHFGPHRTLSKLLNLRYARDVIYLADNTVFTQDRQNEGDIWYSTSISWMLHYLSLGLQRQY